MNMHTAMKSGLKHSWWINAPSIAVLIAMAVLAIMRRPWPALVPVHSDGHRQVNRWGSPWELMVMLPISLLPLGISVVLSAVWVRYEQGRKRFNWIAVLIAAALGLSGGISCWMWWNIGRLAESAAAPHPWVWAIVFAVADAVLTGLLEWVRQPMSQIGDASDDSSLTDKTTPASMSPATLPYHSIQRARWMSALLIGIACFCLFLEGFFLYASRDRWSPIYFAPILLPLLFLFLAMLFGSLQVEVNREQLILRGGLLRARFLRLGRADVQSVRVENFNPLADFGGWGIRYARGTWGYIFRGHRGVRVETRKGKRYLISSDEPEKLAAALQTAAQ